MQLFRRNQAFGLATLGLLTGFSMAAVQGCDEAAGNIAEQCGLDINCTGDGILEGNASISGVASIDGFFGAVINVQGAAANLEAGIRAELLGLAALLEVDGAADLSTDALSAAVEAKLTAELEANIDGSITVNYQPPECKASLEVTAQAAAECDVEVDPGSIEAKCEGSCEIDASAQADCMAEGTLSCEGTAPSLACSGTCTGECNLEVAATCEGTCRGACDGECSARVDPMDATSDCKGTCGGNCTGSCELSAGGNCSGSCEGSCKYEPGSAMCEAGAKASCEATADASVECSGSCEGNVEPPEVSAECKASVEAEAKASVECTPPSLALEYQFAASLDATAQAEFRAFLEGFKIHFSGMIAAEAKAKIVLDAIVNAETGLIASAGGAVNGAIETTLDGDLDLKTSFGLKCAVSALGDVEAALSGAQGSLSASINAFASISGAVGG